MDKLTINELKGYLDTGLKFQLTIDRTEDFCAEDWYSEDKFKKGAIWELIGIVQAKDLNIPLGDGYLDGFLFKNDLTYCNFYCGIKPLLYNLSSLTEYREDLGFVPIVELAKLQYPKVNFTIEDNKCFGRLNEGVVLEFTLDDEIPFYKEYHNNIFGKTKSDSYDDMYLANIKPSEVRDKLYEWKIDLHNLIDRNLAINIKTLKNE